jgi:hypothetical protein
MRMAQTFFKALAEAQEEEDLTDISACENLLEAYFAQVSDAAYMRMCKINTDDSSLSI